jgi:hypothetical protein
MQPRYVYRDGLLLTTGDASGHIKTWDVRTGEWATAVRDGLSAAAQGIGYSSPETCGLVASSGRALVAFDCVG